MLWIAVVICYISAGYHYFINRYRWMNAGFVGSFIWATVLLINAISPFDWYPMSERGELYVLFGSLSFCIGLFSAKKLITDNDSKTDSSPIIAGMKADEVPNVFFLLQTILIVLMIPMSVKAGRIFISSGYNMYMVRYLYSNATESQSLMNTFQRLFYIHYVVGPCSTACVIYDAILCVENRFWKKPLLYMVLLVLLQTIYTAGRTDIFFTLFMLLFVYAFYTQIKRGDYSMKIVKRRLRILFIVLGGIVVFMTLMRNVSKDNAFINIIETVVVYFCGGTRVFDQTLQNPMMYGFDTLSFGICTFAGLLSVITTIQTYTLGRLGISIIPETFSSYSIAQGYVTKRITYGLNSAMNAFPTMLYYFVRDFGIIGALLIPFIFGRIVNGVEKRFIYRRELFNGFKYFYLMYVILMSVCWWEPMRQEFWMTLIWGLLICRLILKPKLTIVFGKK